MKTKAPIKLVKMTFVTVLFSGLLTIGQFANAQSLNSANQKQEAVEKEVKTGAVQAKSVEAEKAETTKPNLQSAPALQKPAPAQEQMRQEKLRKEADAAKRKAEPARSETHSKSGKGLQSEEAATTAKDKAKLQKELGTKTQTGAPADEIAKKKAELELRRQHGKITEEEYQAALKKLEAISGVQPKPAEKPQLETPDKK